MKFNMKGRILCIVLLSILVCSTSFTTYAGLGLFARKRVHTSKPYTANFGARLFCVTNPSRSPSNPFKELHSFSFTSWKKIVAVGLTSILPILPPHTAFASPIQAPHTQTIHTPTPSAETATPRVDTPTSSVSTPYPLFEEVWSVVRDNYIDPTYNHQDWQAIHDRYVQKLGSSPLVSEVEQTKKMLALLGDKYTRLLSPSAYADMYKYDAIGVGLLFTSDERGGNLRISAPPLRGSEAASLGIRKGDKILSIQGEGVDKLTALDILDKLSTDTRKTITMEIAGDKGLAPPRVVSLTRKNPPQDKNDVLEASSSDTGAVMLKYYPLHGGGGDTSEVVAVITLREFSAAALSPFTQAVQEVLEASRTSSTRLVLDLRGNTGGGFQFALNVGSHLLGAGVEMVEVKSRGLATSSERGGGGGGDYGKLERGVFSTPELPSRTFQVYEKPVVILMDQLTASASEVLAGGLRDNCHAILAGTRSFGKGVIQGVYGIEGGPNTEGYGMTVTVGEYLTPRGDTIQGKGLPPDLPLSLSPPILHLVTKGLADPVDFSSSIDWDEVDRLQKTCKVDYEVPAFARGTARRSGDELVRGTSE